MNRNTRLFSYDFLKALSILGIVFYHLHSIRFGEIPADGSVYYPGVGKVFYGLLSAGIPLFFMVNGAIVGNREVSLTKCLKNTFRIILIAVFWTLFFKWILYPYLFQEPRTPDLWQLWEYYWFFYTYAVVQVLAWVLNRFNVLRRLVLGALFVFPFLTNFVWDLILFISPTTAMPSWGHTGFLTLYTIVYYYLGRSLVHFRRSYACSVLLIIAGLLLLNFEVFSMSNARGFVFDSVSSCLPTFGTMSISVGFFMLLKDWTPNPSFFTRVFSFLGQRTLGIYLFQATLNKLVIIYLFHQQYQSPLLVALSAIIVVVIAALIWAVFFESTPRSGC